MSVIFRPAKIGKSLTKARQRQTDNIEIAAFDAWNVAAGASLNRIRASFIERFAGREIARNLFVRNLREVDVRCLDETAALNVGQPNQRDPGHYRMPAPGEFSKHLSCIFACTRFA